MGYRVARDSGQPDLRMVPHEVVLSALLFTVQNIFTRRCADKQHFDATSGPGPLCRRRSRDVKFVIVAVGHKLPEWINAGFNEYAQRRPRASRIELVEIKTPGPSEMF